MAIWRVQLLHGASTVRTVVRRTADDAYAVALDWADRILTANGVLGRPRRITSAHLLRVAGSFGSPCCDCRVSRVFTVLVRMDA